jgi:hypothetical protein
MISERANDLMDLCRERFEAPHSVGERELDLIANLADAIGRAVGEWATLAARMELASEIEPGRARALVLETVFDEALAPPAWRVLAELLAAA